jgi:hypothetical protein
MGAMRSCDRLSHFLPLFEIALVLVRLDHVADAMALPPKRSLSVPIVCGGSVAAR